MSQKHYEWPPKEGFVVMHYLTVANIPRSTDFYTKVIGGNVIREGSPTLIELANSWLLLDVGGGPTSDKPDVTLTPLNSPNEIHSFMNIRVADVHACYQEWKARGARFLTEPTEQVHDIRCYMRDPDGYLIEVGQTKF